MGEDAKLLDDAEWMQLALAAGAIIGTWFWDLTVNRLTIDEGFAAAFGLEPLPGPIGHRHEQVMAIVHPDDKPGLAAAIDAAIARGGPYAHQYRVRRPDGRYRWIEANGRVDKAADGTPLRFPGVLLDVEQRRAVEAERDRAHILARTIMEASPGVVFAKDRQGRMIAGNRGTTALIGKPLEEYLGKTDLENLSDPEQARRIMANDRRIMDSGIGEQLEEEVRLPSGDHAVWLSTKAPLLNAAGEVTGLVGTSIDITSRKAVERERLELNTLLQERIDQAMAERDKVEEALRQSQKMEAVGQLTGGVAHDFNNLLTIIRSSVDLLRRPELPPERQQRYLDAVSDTVDRAAKLTRQLLAFARRQALKPESFAVDVKLAEIADMLATIVGSTVTITIMGCPKDCFIHADVSQFETAIVNMAINARDAMGGQGTVTLSVTSGGGLPSIRGHGPAPGSFVAVSVSDTGEGIPADRLASIFEPFYTTKAVGKGTGLGLSQVYGFAKQSGGDIAVESVPGRGTTFTLYLPQVTPAAPVIPAPAAELAQAGDGRSVLVVEDNVEVGRFATQILDDLGYRARWVVNAEEALRVLETEGDAFDVVFSDVVMPGMGGVELARRLGTMMPHLPVILASGYSHVLAEDGDHGFALLHKPYSAEQLSRMLRTVTGKAA